MKSTYTEREIKTSLFSFSLSTHPRSVAVVHDKENKNRKHYKNEKPEALKIVGVYKRTPDAVVHRPYRTYVCNQTCIY